MQLLLSLAVFVALCLAVDSKYSAAKVQVYSRDPGEFGKSNVLICHVSEFHPPDITIEILKNGEVLPNAQQTDLAFKPDWHFHLTHSVAFTPANGDKVLCRVTHGQRKSDFAWDPNM